MTTTLPQHDGVLILYKYYNTEPNGKWVRLKSEFNISLFI